MEKLSIEEKAARYDRSIERARDVYTYYCDDREQLRKIESIFPELKESEGERIRKELIDYLKERKSGESYGQYIIRYERWISWLEEQSEKNEEILILKDQIESLHAEIIALKEVHKIELEKQSEDKKEDLNILQRFSFYSYKDEPNVLYLSNVFVNEEFRNKGIGTKILKVADKVAKSLDCHTIRLKTKKNSNAERLYRTYGYNSLATEESDEIWLEKQGEQKPAEGYNITSIGSKSVQDKLREMIKNPKSVNEVEPKFNFKVGQWIVATGKCVYLIDKIDGFNVTLIDTNGDEYVFDASSLDDAHEWTIQDAKDGDVLSCREGQWCFIYKEIIYDNIFKYYALLSEEGITVNDAVFNLLSSCIIPATKEQRDLLFQKLKEAGYEWDVEKLELKKIEQKPAWSEEDEKMIRGLIVICDEWTTRHSFYPIENCEIEKLKNWLESLKDRYTWKPSDEQMERLKGTINSLPHQEVLYSLYQDLLKLREE